MTGASGSDAAGSSAQQGSGGSNTGGQRNDAGGTLSNADLWIFYGSGAGAGSSLSGSDEGSLADDPTISAQYTGGSGIGRITPLVYNPESDGPPVFHSGVWTGDDGSVQFVQTAGEDSSPDGVALGGVQQPNPPFRSTPYPWDTPYQYSNQDQGWGNPLPPFDRKQYEAGRDLTGLPKMIHDHGPVTLEEPVDTAGNFKRYTFADNAKYMEPVEPPQDQYHSGAVIGVGGWWHLAWGGTIAGATRVMGAEFVEEIATNTASQAVDDATGGQVAGLPPWILSILFGIRPRASKAAGDAAGATARNADDAVGAVDDGGLARTAPSTSPAITPQDLQGKTADEIRQLAIERGLIPHPTRSDRWLDPVTGKQRLRLDPGHIDRDTGLPYDDPKAAGPHHHGYEPDGKTKVVDPDDGNPHFPSKL